MATLSVGKTSSRGVTLIELLVVVALIALMVGISAPAITSGVDTLRLNAATQSVVTFLNSGLNRAERRQQVVQVTVSREAGSLTLRSSEPGFTRELTMPEGITIERILPAFPETEEQPPIRNFTLYPGGAVPRMGLLLANRRHSLRSVSVDPITGVPQVSIPQ